MASQLQPELDQPYQPASHMAASHMAANRTQLVAYFANELDEANRLPGQAKAEQLAQQVIDKMAGIDTLPRHHLDHYLLVGVSMVNNQMLEFRMVADDGCSAILRIDRSLVGY